MFDKIMDKKTTIGADLRKPPDQEENKKILLVDDDKNILNTLSLFFENEGFETTVASNGFDALNKFLRKSFDIVITDLNMKGMDGFSLVKKMKDRLPEIPVILMTGENPDFVKKAGRNSKVDFILYKPFKFSEIDKLISCILEKENKRPSLKVIYQ